MAKRLTVVVSTGQSNHPAKRKIEEEIIAGLLGEAEIELVIVPYVYDLTQDSPGMLSLSSISGDMVVCSWLYPRSAFWILDRNGIRGKEGKSLLLALGEDEVSEHEDALSQHTTEDEQAPRVADTRPQPSRAIYCLDLRTYDDPAIYIEEIQRIAKEQSTQTVELMHWIKGSPEPEQLERYLAEEPTGAENNFSANGVSKNGSTEKASLSAGNKETPSRRWYPVIDFSRCTNCLECIDFCLFGVYGIDGAETILVEQPDNCRKGCPACSRVCPENAIIFPQHKTPIISGSPELGGPHKIDLSKLFGAPEQNGKPAESAEAIALREREEQLRLAKQEGEVLQEVASIQSVTDQSQDQPFEKAEETEGFQVAAETHNESYDALDQLLDQLDALDF